MALFGQKGKDEDVTALIGKKNYARAIEVLREQIQTKKNDPRVRNQLADVLTLAGKGPQAIPILMGLADEYARDGFAAKAISVLKKIQRIDPSRRDVETKLASLIQEKQSLASVAAPPAAGGFEIGMEEIGIEGPSLSAASPELGIDSSEPELGMETAPEREADTLKLPPVALPAPEPVVEPEPPAPASDDAAFSIAADDAGLQLSEEPPLDIAVEPEPSDDDLLVLEPEPATPKAPVIDRDFIEEDAEVEAAEPANPMSDGAFADELMSLVDTAFKDFPADAEGNLTLPQQEESAGGAQIVISPLFQGLSVDEMVALIQGLKLLTFERGDVILREGQAGGSMYTLTAGSVRAFVKRDGKQVKLGDLEEGAFFGEISLLTGKPRSATIAALSHCELLELDRSTLDSIAERHPHVMDVLQQFAQQRLKARG